MVRSKLLLVLILAVAVPACDGLTGLEDRKSEVVLRQFDGSVPSSLLADVASIQISIKGVRMARYNHYVEMEYVGPARVDLLALPTEGGLKLARALLPTALYSGIELDVADATITFKREVTVGTGASARSFAANQVHPLAIVRDGVEGNVRVRIPNLRTRLGYAPTVPLQFDGIGSLRRLKVVNDQLRLDPLFTPGAF